MDNRIFNVNGHKPGMLLDTLKLVFSQEGDKTLCHGWVFSKSHGLILLWYADDQERAIKFPTPLTPEQCAPIVEEWLKSKNATEVELDHWDSDYQHDGSNGPGWRVYVEDWGHVSGLSSAICAIKPAFMWYGK